MKTMPFRVGQILCRNRRLYKFFDNRKFINIIELVQELRSIWIISRYYRMFRIKENYELVKIQIAGNNMSTTSINTNFKYPNYECTNEKDTQKTIHHRSERNRYMFHFLNYNVLFYEESISISIPFTISKTSK